MEYYSAENKLLKDTSVNLKKIILSAGSQIHQNKQTKNLCSLIPLLEKVRGKEEKRERRPK